MYQLKENEVWVKDYEGRYFVTTDSEVWSVVKKSPKKLTGAVIYDGKRNTSTYRILCLTHEDGVSASKYLHRIVAEAFIPNPENKPTVNHINGKKQDNRIDNLEWATHSEQTIHMYANCKIKDHPSVVMMQDETVRRGHVDRYLKYGTWERSEGHVRKYVNEEDLVRNGIPVEVYYLNSMKKLSYLDMWVVMLVLGFCIRSGRTLQVTADITGFDQSTISKIRSGDRRPELLQIYDQYKDDLRYIDPHLAKISTKYNGGAK